ncbi:MAG: 50S ribosomal protein L28 [Chloroflexus sp.]|uniref:50S ribosomal protein L28 n=1 Tax=Chloroflexus sp. TaxID=1904827 RepID=UPI0030B23E26
MSRRCDLTGRSPSFGHNVSFSKRRTNRRWLPNVQERRIWVPEEQRFVRLKLSAAALREIERKGLLQALRDRGLTLKDVERRSRA